jgi:hypothetical protein
VNEEALAHWELSREDEEEEEQQQNLMHYLSYTTSR